MSEEPPRSPLDLGPVGNRLFAGIGILFVMYQMLIGSGFVRRELQRVIQRDTDQATHLLVNLANERLSDPENDELTTGQRQLLMALSSPDETKDNGVDAFRHLTISATRRVEIRDSLLDIGLPADIAAGMSDFLVEAMGYGVELVRDYDQEEQRFRSRESDLANNGIGLQIAELIPPEYEGYEEAIGRIVLEMLLRGDVPLHPEDLPENHHENIFSELFDREWFFILKVLGRDTDFFCPPAAEAAPGECSQHPDGPSLIGFALMLATAIAANHLARRLIPEAEARPGEDIASRLNL